MRMSCSLAIGTPTPRRLRTTASASAFAGQRINELIRVSFWIFTFLPFAVLPLPRALRPEEAEKNGLAEVQGAIPPASGNLLFREGFEKRH